MRIFIAIPISPNLQSVIRVWQKEHSQLMVRWVKGKNLHITLIPPWEGTDIKSLKDRLSQLRDRLKPFEIEFREITFGPHQNKRKLIWAQGPATKQIIELRDTIEKAIDIKNPYRPWKPHITLARFNPKHFSSFPLKNLKEDILWPEKITSFVIIQTHQTSEGSDYEILATFEF